MNILTAYIVKEILKGSMVALLLLTTIVNLFTFSDELGSLGKGDYDLIEVLWYLALTTPKVIYELMPSAALLGSLFVLGAMAKNRELAAMRVSGVSLFGLLKRVLLAGGIMVLFAIGIGEFVAPDAQRTAKLLRTKAKTQDKMALWQGIYGLWLRDNNMFINVGQIHGVGDLADVSVYELNEQDRLQRLTYASRVRYVGNEQWVMENVKTTEIAEHQLIANNVDEQLWRTSIEPDLLNIVVVDPNDLSLYDLAMYIRFLQENNQKAQVFELAFWGRLINPWITLVMLLVATPFVMGLNRVQATGTRMMLGVVIGMTFNVFDKIIGNVGLIYNVNPALVAILPSAVVLTVALYAISRLR